MFREVPDENQYKDPHGGDSIWIWASRLSAIIIIVFICWLFYQLCEPTPNLFEQAVFYILMLLVFLETIYAGWYSAKK